MKDEERTGGERKEEVGRKVGSCSAMGRGRKEERCERREKRKKRREE